MQYCSNCRVWIRGKKAGCPLCRRGLVEKAPPSLTAGPLVEVEEAGPKEMSEAPGPNELTAETWREEDPFIQLPAPRVSFRLMVRVVTFVVISLEILLQAAQIISGGANGWIAAVSFFLLIGWADFLLAAYYRSNLIRMLTTQAYIIMLICLLAARITGGGSWAVTWVLPGTFLLLIALTFIVARAQDMELHEFILYPAFDVLMSLLQIIPIALGRNPMIAPAVICIAAMLILVSSLVIFRGEMLRDAALKYLHL